MTADASNPAERWQIRAAVRPGLPCRCVLGQAQTVQWECLVVRYNDSFGGGPGESLGAGPAMETLE
jgi:hypothetical protein